ncbi:MAG TPA: hypothetical protein PKE21_09400 [Flavobacteriales bacterium]|nr:hypothetical protein [Flavobacteriales bacterium]HMR27678.1 hypothetical protein [Flavobacteriales bacterium]
MRVCTVVLALQFIVPPTVHAGHGTPLAELNAPAAEDACGDPDPDAADGPATSPFEPLLPHHRACDPAPRRATEADRPGCAMLPASGLHPSAP